MHPTRKQITTSFFIALLSPLALPSAASATDATYSQVTPILQKNCLACHSAAAKMGGLVMESYDSLMKGGTHGVSIVPGKSEQSRIVQMLEGKVQPRMPFGGNPLPPDEIAAIKAWIDVGAKGPATGEESKPLQGVAIPDIKPQKPMVSPVSAVRFSPDGKTLAVGGYKEVKLLDPVSGKVLGVLGDHEGVVRSIAFSPDGKWLAAGSGLCQQSGEIKLWDLAARQSLRAMKGHTDCIYSVAFSPNGKMLASGSYDKTVMLWNASTGEEIKTLRDHIDAVFAVAFSPDGKWLATGSQDRSVKIWDVASGKRLYTLGDALDGLTSIAFSPSGKRIAAGGYDKTIWIWDLAADGGNLTHSLIADEDSILSIEWSPDGKEIVTSSSDGSIRVRDATTLDPIRVIDKQPDWVEALSLSPDGHWLAAGRWNGTVSLYDLKNFEQVVGPMVAFAGSAGASADKGDTRP